MGSERYNSYLAVCIFALSISLFASICAILIGLRVGAKNSHGLLVLSMNSTQLVYAIAVFFINLSVIYFDYNQFIISESISMLFGLTSTFLSNILAFAAFYIVSSGQSLNIVGNIKQIFLWCSTPSLVIAIVYLIVSYPENEVAQVRLPNKYYSLYKNLTLFSF